MLTDTRKLRNTQVQLSEKMEDGASLKTGFLLRYVSVRFKNYTPVHILDNF